MNIEKQQQLEQIELTIDQALECIKYKEALNRLYNNADFKSIILDGYFRQEASRLVHARAEPALQSSEEQTQLLRRIDGVGFLRQFFNSIFQFGQTAERTLESHRDTRAELMSEVD